MAADGESLLLLKSRRDSPSEQIHQVCQRSCNRLGTGCMWGWGNVSPDFSAAMVVLDDGETWSLLTSKDDNKPRSVLWTGSSTSSVGQTNLNSTLSGSDLFPLSPGTVIEASFNGVKVLKTVLEGIFSHGKIFATLLYNADFEEPLTPDSATGIYLVEVTTKNHLRDVLSPKIDAEGNVMMQGETAGIEPCKAAGNSLLPADGKGVGRMSLVFTGDNCRLPAGSKLRAMYMVFTFGPKKELFAWALSTDKLKLIVQPPSGLAFNQIRPL